MERRIFKPGVSAFEERQRDRERTGYCERCKKKESGGEDPGMRGKSRNEGGERRGESGGRSVQIRA